VLCIFIAKSDITLLSYIMQHLCIFAHRRDEVQSTMLFKPNLQQSPSKCHNGTVSTVPHFSKLTSTNRAQISIKNTNEESNSPQKSYSNQILFGKYPEDIAEGNNSNESKAPVPHEFDFHPDLEAAKSVYMQRDGSFTMVYDDELDDSTTRDSISRGSSKASMNILHTIRLSASRQASRPASNRPTSAPEQIDEGLSPSFHYSISDVSRPGTTNDNHRIVVRPSSDGNRPNSPAQSIGNLGIMVSSNRKPSANTAPITGIAHEFQPTDWNEDILQGKDPIGGINKNMTLNHCNTETKIFSGVAVRVLKQTD
jgi:hypothetical protein